MRVSRIVLLLVALLAGGLAAWLATRGGGEPEPAAPEVIQESRDQVLVAKTSIGVGERISAADLEWQDWPHNAVPAEYISQQSNPEAMTELVGAVARFEIFPREPILQTKLVKSDQGYLSAVLGKGQRGVSISVLADSASGGFIVPNDHVDVVLTRGTAAGQSSETILSNVRVLAINTRLGETGKSGAPAEGAAEQDGDPKSQVFADRAIATLELDPGQAETVVNAAQLGKLSLVLRSIVDFAANTNDQAKIQRNAPIRLIRYGHEGNITAGQTTPAAPGDGPEVAPAAYAPTVTLSTQPTVPVLSGPIE